MNWITEQKYIIAHVQGTGKVIEPAGIKKDFHTHFPFYDSIIAIPLIRLDYFPDINLANNSLIYSVPFKYDESNLPLIIQPHAYTWKAI